MARISEDGSDEPEGRPVARCAHKAALHENVERILDFLVRLIERERDAIRGDNLGALIPIEEEVERALGEKERAIGALEQHIKEHGC